MLLPILLTLVLVGLLLILIGVVAIRRPIETNDTRLLPDIERDNLILNNSWITATVVAVMEVDEQALWATDHPAGSGSAVDSVDKLTGDCSLALGG